MQHVGGSPQPPEPPFGAEAKTARLDRRLVLGGDAEPDLARLGALTDRLDQLGHVHLEPVPHQGVHRREACRRGLHTRLRLPGHPAHPVPLHETGGEPARDQIQVERALVGGPVDEQAQRRRADHRLGRQLREVEVEKGTLDRPAAELGQLAAHLGPRAGPKFVVDRSDQTKVSRAASQVSVRADTAVPWRSGGSPQPNARTTNTIEKAPLRSQRIESLQTRALGFQLLDHRRHRGRS
jgi:hypothetical protein